MSLSVEVDSLDSGRWSSILRQFDDASLYQSREHATVRSGISEVGHFRLRRDGDVVGAAQVKIRMLPGGKTGVADVLNGPLWRPRDRPRDIDVFRALVRGIRGEYVDRRGLFLRIRSTETGPEREELTRILGEEQFEPTSALRPTGTYLLDLSPEPEDIRRGFTQRWRRSLNKAERRGMTVRWSRNIEEDFESFRRLYDEMFRRKRMRPRESIDDYWRMHEALEDDLKFRMLVCEKDGEPISINVCSYMGESGLVLFRANGFEAMKMGSSFLLCWHLIRDLKERGFRYYDCGNARSPSLATYKEGLGARRVEHPPPHVAGSTLVGRVCGCWGQRVSDSSREARGALADFACRLRARVGAGG